MRPLIGITTSEVRPLTYPNDAPLDEPFRAEMALGITYTNALEPSRGHPGGASAARRGDDPVAARPPGRHLLFGRA